MSVTVNILGLEVNLLAQLIDLFALVSLIFSYRGDRRKYLLFYSCASVFFCAEFYVLGVISNVFCNLLTIVRNMIVLYCIKKGTEPPKMMGILFMIPVLVIGVYYAILGDIVNVIPTVLTMGITYVSVQKNLAVLKIGSTLIELGFMIFNLFVGAYLGAGRQIFVVTTCIIAVVKYFRERN